MIPPSDPSRPKAGQGWERLAWQERRAWLDGYLRGVLFNNPDLSIDEVSVAVVPPVDTLLTGPSLVDRGHHRRLEVTVRMGQRVARCPDAVPVYMHDCWHGGRRLVGEILRQLIIGGET
jgi:hypothetical protein